MSVEQREETAGGQPAGVSRNQILQPSRSLSDPAEAELYRKNLNHLGVGLIVLTALACLLMQVVL